MHIGIGWNRNGDVTRFFSQMTGEPAQRVPKSDFFQKRALNDPLAQSEQGTYVHIQLASESSIGERLKPLMDVLTPLSNPIRTDGCMCVYTPEAYHIGIGKLKSEHTSEALNEFLSGSVSPFQIQFTDCIMNDGGIILTAADDGQIQGLRSILNPREWPGEMQHMTIGRFTRMPDAKNLDQIRAAIQTVSESLKTTPLTVKISRLSVLDEHGFFGGVDGSGWTVRYFSQLNGGPQEGGMTQI